MPTSATSSPSRSALDLSFAKCMRANGVPAFPDPGTVPTGPENMIGGIAIPSTVDTESPAFRSAQNSCRGLLTAAISRRGRPPISASLKASLIARAQCMRTHGVPAYLDPRFPSTGGIMIQDTPGVNPDAPAYQHAAAECGNR